MTTKAAPATVRAGKRTWIPWEEILQRDLRQDPRFRTYAETIRRALEDERRWDDIVAALGKIADEGHDWDADPAAWVRRQRRGDARHAVLSSSLSTGPWSADRR